MAKISLNTYQDKLESLLEANRFDEVIAHARHILKTWPKNLRAYQQLGAALFAADRWEEAAEVLRRLLGALPQSFQAHSMLAQVYQRLEQYDKAIWHAERAFDRQPNHQDSISLIRSLYRQHRGEEIARLQLTASALAQQHIRGGLLPEALKALNTARQRHPNRIDLRLLQARALWLAGRRAEAAEAALEILTHLPYSKTANRIMAELWLSEQRPSDAQLYLGRIEALDPYLAYQLAGGQTPDDSLAAIEPLDDGAISQPETIVDLDWLNSLEDAAEDQELDSGGIDASGLEALFGMDETAAAPPTATADLEGLLDDRALESLFDEPAAASPDDAPQLEAGGDGISEAQPPPRVEAAQSAADESEPNLTKLLERLDSDDGDPAWLTDIQQGGPETAADAAEHLHRGEKPPLSEPEAAESSPEEEWISAAMRGMTAEQDAGFDLFADDEQLRTLLGKVNETQPIHPDDIEFWLNSSDIDLDEADAAPVDERGREADDFFDADDLTDRSWLDDDLEDDLGFGGDTLDLIDDWQSELDDSGDDDGDIDWLSEDEADSSWLEAAGEHGEPGGRLSAKADDGASQQPDDPPSRFADETARAWGLADTEELADFVEDEVELTVGEAAPDWLNAMVPGLDGDIDEDAAPDEGLAASQSAASSAKDFDWVNDIVAEETSEMEPVAPPPTARRFDFSQPPRWLTELLTPSTDKDTLAAAASPLPAAAAVDELNFDALDLELGMSDFDFDAPTEKIIPIGAAAASADVRFDELDFDDYFDFDAPTEKITAINTAAAADEIDFEELGLEDEDFDFDAPTEKITAINAAAAADEIDFDELDAPPPADSDDQSEWLEYDDLDLDADDFDFSDPDKKAGRASSG